MWIDFESTHVFGDGTNTVNIVFGHKNGIFHLSSTLNENGQKIEKTFTDEKNAKKHFCEICSILQSPKFEYDKIKNILSSKEG